MLGNWSLGDYFKEDAIKWSFEFLTEVLNIPVEKLAVTVFAGNEIAPRDEEAINLWKSLGIKDERIYDGTTIYFYKLAQLLTSDILHIRSNIEKIEVDYSHLLGCADYKIPQIMRALGIIEYNDELSLLVDNKQELCVSSLYEVEIRASMIVVINYIADKINYPAMDINDYFFTSGKNAKTKIKPYHLCRNTNY